MQTTHLDLLSNRSKQNLTNAKLIQIINDHPNLESLDLSEYNITKNILEAIAKCENLKTLDLSGCRNLTDVSVFLLRINKPGLIIHCH